MPAQNCMAKSSSVLKQLSHIMSYTLRIFSGLLFDVRLELTLPMKDPEHKEHLYSLSLVCLYIWILKWLCWLLKYISPVT